MALPVIHVTDVTEGVKFQYSITTQTSQIAQLHQLNEFGSMVMHGIIIRNEAKPFP